MSPSKRRRVIAGNWKMCKTLAETRAFFSAFTPLVANATHCNIVIAPPFTAVSAAVEAALAAGLTPIVCVGETLAHREAGQTEQVCKTQFTGGLAALTPAEFSRILVAYEPVWAIGTGRTATPEIAAEAHSILRRCAGERFSVNLASALRILAGRSVKPDIFQGLMAQEELDGALVGG